MGKNKNIPLSRRTKKRRIADQISIMTRSLQVNHPIISSTSHESPELIHHSSDISENEFIQCNELPNILPDDLISDNQIPALSSEDELVKTSNSLEQFIENVRIWASNFKISNNSLDALLIILKEHKCFQQFPRTARTVMQTKPIDINNMHIVEPGHYYHFGIKKGIKRYLPNEFEGFDIKIVIGVDGLPISKSNSNQFWPILAYIRPSSAVFPIGIYFGKLKPKDNNQFLDEMCKEASELITNGLEINNIVFNFSIDALCCDAPAKSFLLKTKGHSGFYSCTRCQIEGEYLQNRMCFPYESLSNASPKRSHNDYLEKNKEEFHISNDVSIIASLPGINVDTSFSLDYMHLICLGVVRKLIMMWIKGPVSVRYPSWKIKEVSSAMEKLKAQIPCEFARKPRSFDEISRWKATEYRTFLLYTGPIVMKSILKKDHWKHFLALSISMTILLSPDHSKFLFIARNLLDYFLKRYEQIYGSYLMSHNVHGLNHISDDYDMYGPLDNVSAFPFENYMGQLKKMLRKPHKPLEQIVKRYNETFLLPLTENKLKQKQICSGLHQNDQIIQNNINELQFKTLNLKNVTLKTHVEADSYFLTTNNEVVKLMNIIRSTETHVIRLVGKIFLQKYDLYQKPFESSKLNVNVVNLLSNELFDFSLKSIKKKMILIPYSNNGFISMPIVHNVNA